LGVTNLGIFAEISYQYDFINGHAASRTPEKTQRRKSVLNLTLTTWRVNSIERNFGKPPHIDFYPSLLYNMSPVSNEFTGLSLDSS